MSTSTDTAIKTVTSKNSTDEVFAMWKTRKESINKEPAIGLKPPAENNTRRQSKLGLQGHMKSLTSMRRMTLSIRAKSDISADMLKPTVKKENTYKMKPDDGSGFSPAKVQKAVLELLENEFEDQVYDHDSSSQLTCMISERVKDKVKEMNFPRHKISVNVIVGQNSDQGVEVASRCVWDETTDTSACVTYTNKDLFIIALIFENGGIIGRDKPETRTIRSARILLVLITCYVLIYWCFRRYNPQTIVLTQ